MTALCHKERFSAAHVLLTGSGLSAEDAPGLWEYVARQAALAGHDDLAHRVRETLWQAGLLSDPLALDEGAYYLEAEDAEACIYVLESHFGALPTQPEALEYLTRAHMLAASRRTSGGKLRTSRATALRLTQNIELNSPAHAIAAVDLLRFADEIDRSVALNAQARATFPDDIRFTMRDARIAEQKGAPDTALRLWREVADTSERYRSDALFKLLSLSLKREDSAAAGALAAELACLELPLDARLQLALLTGQEDMALAVSQYVSENAGNSDAVSYAEGKAVGDLLLQAGYFGLVLWLRRQRVTLSERAKAVLDASRFGEELGLPLPANFQEAAALRSPACMLPLRDFMHLPERPAGWPAPRQTAGRILLVNSSLKAGGAERQFVALVRALLDAGLPKSQIDVALFNLDADRARDHFLPDLMALDVSIHNLSQLQIANPHLPQRIARVVGALPAGLQQDARQLWHLCQDLRPDVIHGWQDRSAAAAGLVAELSGTERVVLSMRNMAPHTRQDRGLTLFKPLLQSWARLPNVTLTANAGPAAADYEAWLGCDAGTVDVLRNAVNIDNFAPIFEQIKRRKPHQGPLRVGGVFRLATNKRPLLWLETLAALRDTHGLQIAPQIYGDGPLRDQIIAHAAQLGFKDLMITTGASDPRALYGDLDILLLMSRVEGLPNVLLEAQACGLPVAACDVGGVREAVQTRGDASALVMDADISATEAADALAAWLPAARAADPQPRHGFVRTHFAPETLAQACLKAYTGTAHPLHRRSTA
ncbi:glycosyltransferase [Cognatishimia sp. SS12]|uniref:glycosyltransferase n=1 Tax=Cognatishimia sp. SS12 TaxID=2979465 RepID=UPI00232D8486|nr:glycosyltransferase [Cognatishimia sp. SS12]MDC0739509.1 glycosyltransferase [Cognatishimia sp. SS12]